MKSALPKVLHRAPRPSAHRTRPARRRLAVAQVRPSSSSATRPIALKTALGERPGLELCIAGAAARHRPRAAAGGTASARARPGTVVLLSGDVPLLGAATPRALVRTHQERRAAATVLTAIVDRPRRVRPHRPRQAAHRRDRRAQGRVAGGAGDRRDQQRHLRVRPRPAVRRAARASARRTRRGSTTCPTWCRIYRERGLDGGDRAARRPARDPRREQPEGAGGRERNSEQDRRTKQLMAAGVTIVDPATTYIDPDVERRRRHGASTPVSISRAGRAIGAGCEIHAGVRIVDSTIDDGVVDQQLLRDHASRTFAAGAIVGPFAHLRPRIATSARGRTSATSSS